MSVVITDLRSARNESGNTKPQRAMDAQKIVVTADTDSGWIKKEYLAVVSLHAAAAHTGITAQVWGRFNADATTEHQIGDKDGVNLSLDLDQGANGTSFILDAGGLCDQIKLVFSGSVTGTFVLAFGA